MTLEQLIDQEIASLRHRLAALESARTALRPKKLVAVPRAAAATTPARRKGRAPTKGTDEAVRQAIQAGCATVAAIVDGAKLPDYNVRQALKRLIASGVVQASGATTNRRFALTGKSAFKSDSLLGIA